MEAWRYGLTSDTLAVAHLGRSYLLTGAILEEIIKEGEGPKIKGSIMLARAESEDEVVKALQEDIYFKDGVWDWNNRQIHPVYLNIPSFCAESNPLTVESSKLPLGKLLQASTSSIYLRLRASIRESFKFSAYDTVNLYQYSQISKAINLHTVL